MKDDKKVIALIVSIPLVAVLLIFAISKVKFELALSPIERKIYNFNSETIPKIVERKPVLVRDVRLPINVAAGKVLTGYPRTALSTMAPVPVITEKATDVSAKEVSFILIGRDKSFAIIDGKFVSEGDTVAEQQIVKIEKKGVLLKNRECEKWLALE